MYLYGPEVSISRGLIVLVGGLASFRMDQLNPFMGYKKKTKKQNKPLVHEN